MLPTQLVSACACAISSITLGTPCPSAHTPAPGSASTRTRAQNMCLMHFNAILNYRLSCPKLRFCHVGVDGFSVYIFIAHKKTNTTRFCYNKGLRVDINPGHRSPLDALPVAAARVMGPPRCCHAAPAPMPAAICI